VEKLFSIVATMLAVLLGGLSLLQIIEWRKADSRVVRMFTPAEGVYAAPAASSAGGQWSVFSCFWIALMASLLQFDVRALIAFSLLFTAFLCGGIGAVVWLFMPDSWLVPKALRGAPGYLEVRGVYDPP
jgi:hypothetical protein